MVGTISLYDALGERQHTIYIGATQSMAKLVFWRLEREIGRTKATYIGIADGAASNWQFLNRHTTQQVLDFYHASGYLGAAVALYPKDLTQQQQWLNQTCHQLKHDSALRLNSMNRCVSYSSHKDILKPFKII